jgi:hypothetical protein
LNGHGQSSAQGKRSNMPSGSKLFDLFLVASAIVIVMVFHLT